MFVLTSDGGLVPLKPAQFVLEDDFQRSLETYPELLSGELIDPENPRRWLLISREIPVPGETDGYGWWSADHLFLDQDGVPTIVEVKRQTDTRLRREVVAQMLDYAANSTAYWTAESIRSAYEATCNKSGRDPELALELRQYSGENGLRTLAPTLFGQTEGARAQKPGAASSKSWDQDTFFAQLASNSSADAVASARLIVSWIDQHAATGSIWGHGKVDGSVTGYLKANGLKLYPITIMTSGKLYVGFRDCMKPPFDDLAKRREFLEKLNAIPGVKIPDESIARQPPISLDILAVQGRTDLLLNVLDWFVKEVAIFESHPLS